MPQTTVVQDDAAARKKFPKLNAEDRAGGAYEVLRIMLLNIYFHFYAYLYFTCVRIIQVHSGSCKAPCEGMEDLGAFEAFNLRATNNGPVLFKISRINNRLVL